MELVRCRELFDVIQELGSFCGESLSSNVVLIYISLTESDASMIFKQILLAMQYMHSNGVCHRDLKPNNILASNGRDYHSLIQLSVLFTQMEKSSKSLISMFRSSLTGRRNSTLGFPKKTIECGPTQEPLLLQRLKSLQTQNTRTIDFFLPPSNNKINREMVDVWSAGCVLYTMLCGYQPFQAE